MTLDGARWGESHARSFVKGVSWRVIGTLDTFIWSLLITHKPFAAASIASLETITKVLLFYGHERIWRLIEWAPEGHLRALVKAVVWRFVGSLDTFLLSLLVTGKLQYAVSIASVEALTKILLYYLHERGWKLIKWGRELEAASPPPPVAAT
jgi:uncharacterized membrane protein